MSDRPGDACDGRGRSFALVVSRFNEFVTRRLRDGAADCLREHGTEAGDVHELWVPGAFEIPLVAKTAAESGLFDAVICLGAVIRGGTPHFDYIAAEVSKGIAKINLDTGIPVILGVITADTLEQAVERSGTKSGNKGFDAAVSAIEMANLVKSIG